LKSLWYPACESDAKLSRRDSEFSKIHLKGREGKSALRLIPASIVLGVDSTFQNPRELSGTFDRAVRVSHATLVTPRCVTLCVHARAVSLLKGRLRLPRLCNAHVCAYIPSNKHIAVIALTRVLFLLLRRVLHRNNARALRDVVNPTAAEDNRRNSLLRNTQGAELRGDSPRKQRRAVCTEQRDCEAAFSSAMHLLQQCEPKSSVPAYMCAD